MNDEVQVERISHDIFSHASEQESFVNDLGSLGIEPGQGIGSEWFLGYDGNCPRCEGIEELVRETVGSRITTVNLHEPVVRQWRNEVFGDKPPWAPTLFCLKDGKVEAWTGKMLAMKLVRLVGPGRAWILAQKFAEAEVQPHSGVLGRRTFLKGLTGATAGLAMLKSVQDASLANGPNQCSNWYAGYEDYGSKTLAITSNCRDCPWGNWVTDVYRGNIFYHNYSVVSGIDGYRWFHSSGPLGCWVRSTQFY